MGALGLLWLLAACAPSPAGNVMAYLSQQWQAGLVGERPPAVADGEAAGVLVGTVHHLGQPVAGVTVLVAERTGLPHAVVTDSQGRYRIEPLPPGDYVPAAIGPGLTETWLQDRLGIPWLISVPAGGEVTAPPLALSLARHAPLPSNLAQAVALQAGAPYTATAVFPEGSAAWVYPFRFSWAGAEVDSLRVYLPLDSRGQVASAAQWPLLFAVYPGLVDNWLPVSVALASHGYGLVAISPSGARGLDIEAHAEDARVALGLARAGALGAWVGRGPAVALGGSFSSAILHRLLRAEHRQFAGWITVGGISNAFSGTASFYAGELTIPPEFALMIPALGQPNLYPGPFLRYSPVYTAAELPPTLVIHTSADEIIPIAQAYELEAALRAAGVPVEVFYYTDVSHLLLIGEDMTPEGAEMFDRVLDFVRRYAGG